MPKRPFSFLPFGYGAAFLAMVLLIPLALLAWHLAERRVSPLDAPASTGGSLASFSAGPPWLYGQAGARYTVTLYADLECPYCKAYFPILKSWIDSHPETVLEWSHLPLPSHEPTATELALLAECAGEAGGHSAFWNVATWIYQHTRSDGQGLPPGMSYPGVTRAVEACTASDDAKSVVRAQVQQASSEGIDATPSVKLHDSKTGKSLRLSGLLDGDALLSALDLISTEDASTLASQ